jgi:hypothetical protein
MGLVGKDGLDLGDVPDVMRVDKGRLGGAAFRRQPFTSLRIPLKSEHAIAMNHVVAPPLELGGDGGLARAGDPFDEVVAVGHGGDAGIRASCLEAYFRGGDRRRYRAPPSWFEASLRCAPHHEGLRAQCSLGSLPTTPASPHPEVRRSRLEGRATITAPLSASSPNPATHRSRHGSAPPSCAGSSL